MAALIADGLTGSRHNEWDYYADLEDKRPAGSPSRSNPKAITRLLLPIALRRLAPDHVLLRWRLTGR